MNTQPVLFINVIDVEPERQQELLALLREGAERVMSQQPGFGGLSLYASGDGHRVINIARWESAEAVAATQRIPAAATYAARTAEIASAHPGLFTLAADIR